MTQHNEPQADLFDRSRSFGKQIECVDFLKSKGFKVSTAKFNRAFKAGLVECNTDGRFEEPHLLTYANIHLELAEQLSDKAAAQANIDRAVEDALLKKTQRIRLDLKLQKEQGKLMPRDEHERDLSARALFFKRELANWPRLWGPALLHMLGAGEDRLQDLLTFWAERSADLTDAWAQGREFTLELEGDSEAGADEDAGAADDD